MADGAATPADATGPLGAPSTSRSAWWPARPPAWAWALSIVLQVLSAAALTSYTYFFVDDWLFIAEARRIPFSTGYLRLPLFEHFSPISRLLDKLLIHDSTGSFALAHSLQLAMYGAAVLAFALVVRTILGNRWSAFVLTILFGQSLFLMRLLNWWTATANILPSTVFELIAIAAYLRWQRSRSPWWLIVTLSCGFGALLDYEIALLLPAYILTIRLLMLDDLRPRTWLAVLRQEWPIWIGFLTLDVAALINYYAFYYLPLPHAPVATTLHFLLIAIFSVFVPAQFGIKNPQLPISQQPLVIVCCLILAAILVAYMLYTRPHSWRCLIAFLCIAVITMLPVGVVRAASWGLHVSKELYYQQSVEFMFLILVAVALRGRALRGTPGPLRPAAARLHTAPAIAAAIGVVIAGGYGVLFVTSVEAMGHSAWEPRRSLAYVRNFQAGVREVIRSTGREPVLLNGHTPADISENGSVPYNSYDIFFPMIDRHVRFNTASTPMYLVGNDGALIAAKFHPEQRGAMTGASVKPDGETRWLPALRRGGDVCGPSGRRNFRLDVPLLGSPRGVAGSGAVALRLEIRSPRGQSVLVFEQRRRALASAPGFAPGFGPGDTTQYVPLDPSSPPRAIALQLAGGSCVGPLVVGTFEGVAG